MSRISLLDGTQQLLITDSQSSDDLEYGIYIHDQNDTTPHVRQILDSPGVFGILPDR